MPFSLHNLSQRIDIRGSSGYNYREVRLMELEKNIYPYDPELAGLPFRLTGIGGSRYQGHIDRPEGYMWHQILFCNEGRGMLRTDGKEYEPEPGCIVFLPKKSPHEYLPLTERWGVCWLSFDGAGCDETLRLLGFDTPLVIRSDSREEAEKLFQKMLDSQTTDILYSGYTCSGLVYELLLCMRRMINTDEDRSRSRRMSMLHPAITYINENYSQDISMSFLAELIGITPQHFCRLFRSTMNMRPGDYLLAKRLEAAQRLILDGGRPIAEIAQLCGFQDAGYFSTVFRRNMGVPPSMYGRNIPE